MTGSYGDRALSSDELRRIDEIIIEAETMGLRAFVNVATNLLTTQQTLELSRRHANIYPTAGIHPCDGQGDRDWKKQLSELEKLLLAGKGEFVALGETGLDFYHKPFDFEIQKALFEGHIELALTHQLPLIVHIRDAGDEALKIIEQYRKEARGVIHCFSLDAVAAETVFSWGWLIGVDGPVSYPRNHDLRALTASMPLDKLLLETDAPFLPPQQFRGKQNHPGYLPLIGEVIAGVRNVSADEIGLITAQNAIRLFQLIQKQDREKRELLAF